MTVCFYSDVVEFANWKECKIARRNSPNTEGHRPLSSPPPPPPRDQKFVYVYITIMPLMKNPWHSSEQLKWPQRGGEEGGEEGEGGKKGEEGGRREGEKAKWYTCTVHCLLSHSIYNGACSQLGMAVLSAVLPPPPPSSSLSSSSPPL